MRATAVPIAGTCAPEFARVGAAFERNFTDHGEIGAAVAVWVEGELVVNLWVATPTPTARVRGGTTPWPACSPVPRD